MIDIITHGSPCQDFSVAGKGKGGEPGAGTRSSLMHTTVDLVAEIRPNYVVWENVKNVLSKKHVSSFAAYLGALEKVGYHNYWMVSNAKNHGVPQNRERVFCVSIRKDLDKYGGYEKAFPYPSLYENGIRLRHLLEENVDKKYFLSEEKMNQLVDRSIDTECVQGLAIREATKKGYAIAELYDGVNIGMPKSETRRGRVGYGGYAHTLQTTCDQGVLVLDDSGNLWIRVLTPLECWRLMAFEDESFYKAKEAGMNETQLYKQAGNSIVVDVLYHIFKNMFAPGVKLNVISLFSGIGAFEKGLERAGVKVNLINYCEIDKYASKSYSAIHGVPESLNLWDVTKIDPKKIIEEEKE